MSRTCVSPSDLYRLTDPQSIQAHELIGPNAGFMERGDSPHVPLHQEQWDNRRLSPKNETHPATSLRIPEFRELPLACSRPLRIGWRKHHGMTARFPFAPLFEVEPPCLYPVSHKFIKLSEICGAECGARMPHIRKKDLDFTLSP